MTAELTIGQVARGAGVNVETVRYYQRRRLLEQPPKPLRGHRRYGVEAVMRLLFIKRAQQLGFTLEEVRSLLRLEDGQNCHETRLLAEEKLAQIEARLDDLNGLRGLLKKLITACTKSKRPQSCPIMSTLRKRPLLR